MVTEQGKIIKELRSRCNMTQKVFAEYTGIPIDTLRNWETGKSKPPEYVLNLLGIAVTVELEKKSKNYGTERRLTEYFNRFEKDS